MLRIHGNDFSLGKLSQTSQLGIAGVISSCALVLLLSLMLFPSLPQDAQAVEDNTAATTQSDDAPVAQNDTGITPRATSVGINLAPSVAFAEVTPTETGATTTATTDLTVTTANSESYSLYLYSDGDSSLKSSDSANISSIIATQGDVGLTLSSLEPNTWGYNLGTTTPDANSTYLGVPTSSDAPILSAVSTPTGEANDNYKLSFGAKVDTTLPAGEYATTLTVAVVAKPAFVTIAFDGNGADGGSMLQQTIIAGDTENLTANAFTRTGYEFTGWNTASNGSGTSYADESSYTAPAESAGQTITLYAQWEEKISTTLQGFTLNQCQQLASDGNYSLSDARDNNTYTVRYINGKCWMTQNLRLSGGTTLTSATSNVASNYTIPTTDLTSGDSSTDGRIHNSGNTTNGYWYNYCATSAGTNCQSSTENGTVYDICPKGWRLPSESEFWSITGYSSAFSPVYSGYYSGGSLYYTDRGLWWSSTAYGGGLQRYLYYVDGTLGTGSYGSGGSYKLGFSVRCIRSNPGTLTINFDGNGSTGGSTTSQQITAGNTANLNTNGFSRANYMFTGWNTAKDGSGITYGDEANYMVTPATGNASITLYAQWEATIPVMQNFTLSQCQTQAANSSVRVVDSRDSNDYTVRYINGACWMTQNLRLSGGRTLTSADSNVSWLGWAFPTGSLTSGNSYTEARSTISSNTSYGGYYNYCAASAGTVCSQTQANATQDICPKGWRLPTINEMSGITSYSSAFSPVYSGYYGSGLLYNTGSYGYWWSATAEDSNYQRLLGFHSSSLYTDIYYGNKGFGYSVRCIRSS